MNNIDKAMEIIDGRLDRDKLWQVSKLVTKEEFLVTLRWGCPSSVGLPCNCSKPCYVCWEQALEHVDSPFRTKKTHTKLEIIEDKDITVALIKNDAGKVVRKGIAKRHVDDTPNRAVGVMVAVSRAMGFDMNRTLEFFTDKELAKEIFDRL